MSKPVTFGPFIRGLDASTGVVTEPKGSFPRSSNLLLTKRGALRTCDGSALVEAFNGVPTPGRGKAMCDFAFCPTGVSAYYLRVMKALDQQLGPPLNLALTVQAGGTLAATTTYYYGVTALDGAGGETTIAANQNATTTSSNKQIQLTWNVVPNAAGGYNVYRGTSPATMVLLFKTGSLPVAQPSVGTLSLTFVDDGSTTTTSDTLAITSITCQGLVFTPLRNAVCAFVLAFPTTGIIRVGETFQVAGSPDGNFNSSSWVVQTVQSNQAFVAILQSNTITVGETANGGTYTGTQLPPGSDTTQQTALYACPPASVGIKYDNSNLVALWPADAGAPNIDGGIGGGGGGGRGGGGGGGGGQQGSTPSGGLSGNVNFIPQIEQFTNQAVIALGNGYPVQVYSDSSGTPTNPAVVVAITSISADGFGVVTVTLASGHQIPFPAGKGANVKIAGVTNPVFNGVYSTIDIPDGTHVKVRQPNAISVSSSGGTMTVTTIPLYSTFVPAYPTWVTAVSISVNSIITPTVSNGHYYKAVQGGVTGGSQPTFPTGTGARVSDGGVIWQEAGLLNTAAPAPPGGAHIAVYAGALWVFNTSTTNTATGIDGPTSLRMSDVNNLNSWNPINQAFLDKDDGQEGLGLATFTIAAQGIPPEGSLCAFKKRTLYQIVGVFGSSNFAIQRAQTDMGTTAPRSIRFVPGFGLMRLTHLGFAVFDGVNDRVVSTQVEPYLSGSNDPEELDIVPIDTQWQSVCWAALTAMPPMYVCAIPVGLPFTSNGALTRLMCFDMVLKAWAVIDLPFAISTMTYIPTVSTIVVTLVGSFSDGTMQRIQAGDLQWATSVAGSNTPGPVAWSLRTPTCASKDADQRLYCRRVTVVGEQTGAAPSTMNVNIEEGGDPTYTQSLVMPQGNDDFQVEAAGGIVGRRFDAVISGQGLITIDAVAFYMEPRPAGVMAGVIS